MWIADRWKDYEVLDAGHGERLERWGEYILRRPDPQILWPRDNERGMWLHAHGIYNRSATGGGEWKTQLGMPQEWEISYGALKFHIRPFSFKHTGLFPEQAVNWEVMASLVTAAGRPVRILNLFAYTGGATCALLKAGAHVTHVDASKGMVGVAKENAALSGLGDAPARYLVDDCVKFVERELRRGSRYDAIVLDPPSYGRGPKGELWKIEEGIYPLLSDCVRLLTDDPLFFFLNMYTTGLQPATLSYLMHTALSHMPSGAAAKDHTIEADEVGLPVSSTSLSLPCGACCRVIWDVRPDLEVTTPLTDGAPDDVPL